MQVYGTFDSLADLDDDYGAAVVRLAWAVDRKSGDRPLLCAGVDLLPHEVPPPVLLGERSETVSRRFFLYTHEVQVSARRGLAWFQDAARGIALRPTSDGAFGDPALPSSARFIVGAFAEEPSGSSMVTATARVPFVADWQGNVRVRHLVTADSPTRAWTEAERRIASEWLKTSLHLELEDFPEYAGSVHLIAPNPVFRSIFARREIGGDGKPSVVVAITPRAGRSVEGLDLLVEEERPTGIGILARVALQEDVVRVVLPHTPDRLRKRVLDPRRGVLFEGQFGIAVSFSIAGNIISQVRRVTPTGDGDAYEVPLAGPMRTNTNIPAIVPRPTSAGLLYSGRGERDRRARGSASQQWFRERAPDARVALRKLIGPVRGRVLICDPYFGGDDVVHVVLAVADPSTTVRVLGSAMHLHRMRGKELDAETEGQYLQRRLTEVASAPQSNPVEVHVMRGRKAAPIHDRFVVAGERDEQMWMLGSSINRFGERGTLIVAVPDPKDVWEDLQRVWNESRPLADWLLKGEGPL
ncbi:MAG: VPA1262 family N-terminal domain-containing protein [Polyangiaceae bacterium]